jgi:hypothetical protein
MLLLTGHLLVAYVVFHFLPTESNVGKKLVPADNTNQKDNSSGVDKNDEIYITYNCGDVPLMSSLGLMIETLMFITVVVEIYVHRLSHRVKPAGVVLQRAHCCCPT